MAAAGLEAVALLPARGAAAGRGVAAQQGLEVVVVLVAADPEAVVALPARAAVARGVVAQHGLEVVLAADQVAVMVLPAWHVATGDVAARQEDAELAVGVVGVAAGCWGLQVMVGVVGVVPGWGLQVVVGVVGVVLGWGLQVVVGVVGVVAGWGLQVVAGVGVDVGAEHHMAV
eukprot:jgi/Chrzof1/9298/UNPLg00266.t1